MPTDDTAYEVEEIRGVFSVVQKDPHGRITWLSAMQLTTREEAEEHAKGLNFLRDKRLSTSTEGKGLHWPPSPSSPR